MPTAAELREEFLLDPDVTFLSHGTFGAVSRPVFERYQAWQLELEREPVDFIARRLPDLLAEARASLAAYLGAAADDVTFVPNASTGVNMAARSLELKPGDEILSTDLEYGACDLLWDRICAETGARIVRAPIPLPVAHADDVVEAVFAQRTERTRIVFVSHVTSATALWLPVEPIVARARAEGLVSIVDGAHAPSQVPVDVDALGADFYAGACNKWLCAPKGTGFLHARPELQERIGGAIVSWGDAEPSTFLSRTERQGTRDAAGYLAVPAAIDFQRERDWDGVRRRCRALAAAARAELSALFGTEPIAAPELVAQMASVRLPPGCDGEALSRRLFDDYRVEIPATRPEHDLLRISVAAYTSREDVERLLDVLPRALSTSRTPASG
jgi:isopenicillin-N epimerase